MIIDPLSGGIVQYENVAQRNFCVVDSILQKAQSTNQQKGTSSQNEDWKNTLESQNNLETQKTQQVQEDMLKELYELRELLYKEAQAPDQGNSSLKKNDSVNDPDMKAQKKAWKKEKEELLKQNEKLKYRVFHMKQHLQVE